jgi:hypothetical protein
MAFSNHRGVTGLAISNIVGIETPAGTINGVNAVFTLANVPDSTNFVLVYLNGAFQTDAGVDYTRVTSTITFVAAPPTSSILRVLYVK